MAAPKGLYEGEGYNKRGVKFKATGEFRPPLKGGTNYLSGALVFAYRAPNDLSTSYWIAKEVKVITVYEDC